MAKHDEQCEKADVGSLCDCPCAGAKHAVLNTRGGVPGAGAVGKRAQAAASGSGRAAVVNNRAQPKDGARVAAGAPKAFKEAHAAEKAKTADDERKVNETLSGIGKLRADAAAKLREVAAANAAWSAKTMDTIRAKNPGMLPADVIKAGRRDPEFRQRLDAQQRAVKEAKRHLMDHEVDKIVAEAGAPVKLNDTITESTTHGHWPGTGYVTHHTYGEQVHRTREEAERWNAKQAGLRPDPAKATVTSRRRNGEAATAATTPAPGLTEHQRLQRDQGREMRLGHSQGRRARVDELAPLSREQFDALDPGEQQRAVADLRRIADSGDVRTARDRYGINYKADQAHVGRAREVLRRFTTAPRAAEPAKAPVAARFDAHTGSVDDFLKGLDRGELVALADAKGWQSAKDAATYKLAYLRKVMAGEAHDDKRRR